MLHAIVYLRCFHALHSVFIILFHCITLQESYNKAISQCQAHNTISMLYFILFKGTTREDPPIGEHERCQRLYINRLYRRSQLGSNYQISFYNLPSTWWIFWNDAMPRFDCYVKMHYFFSWWMFLAHYYVISSPGVYL